jgi:hypothetical protein
MDKPHFNLSQDGQDDFYAFIGRVSLQLVESNVDAITTANFLREIIQAGGSTLDLVQAMNIARNYVVITDTR